MILYFTEKEKLPLSGEIDNLMAHVMKNFMALSSGTVWSRSQQTVSRPTMFDYAYHFWFILECFSLLAICSTRPTVQLFRNSRGIGLTAQAMFSHYCRIAPIRVARRKRTMPGSHIWVIFSPLRVGGSISPKLWGQKVEEVFRKLRLLLPEDQILSRQKQLKL